MTTTIPPVLRTAFVARSVDNAFAVFTDEIGAWWPLATHSVFQAEAGGVHIVDGRVVERATDGRETTWAEVLAWEPPNRLELAWHPGAEAAPGEQVPCGRVEVVFSVEGDGTRVDLRHDGWEAYGEEAMRRRRGYIGPSAWGHVLDHFADGAELRVGGDDLGALPAAYEAFFAAAESGPFGDPTDGGWNASQVVAHVALNDLALTAVAHALVHRQEPTFENRVCQRIDVLDGLIAEAGDFAELVTFGRRCATQAMAAAARLDEDQRSTMVACVFEHDGAVVGEGPMPWAQVAIDVQAARHLPAHVEQLENLRA